MMKFTLLASAIMIASPALAQQTPPSSPATQTAPAPVDTTSPVTSESVPSDQAASTQTPYAPAPAEPTTATQPAQGKDQVAQVVESDFAKYDADGNGSLSSAEFGSWMATLRASSDPAAKVDSTEMKTWSKTAFAQADIDKSKSVSKGELTTFLAKG